jgi:hypothetical protein
MPNGKPGDHPYTDIIVHGRQVYSQVVDDLVRQVADLSDERGRNELADLLLREYDEHAKPDVIALERLLVQRRDLLRDDARRRGWEL